MKALYIATVAVATPFQFAQAVALKPAETESLDALNAKIHAELFLTPHSDAWPGLAAIDVFSALDGDGLVQNSTH